MFIKKQLLGLAVLAALAAPFAASAEPVYSMTFLPSTVQAAAGIDEQGRIAVTYIDTRISQAGIWSGGSTITDVGTLGSGLVGAGGMSPNGYVTGSGELPQSQGFLDRAFLYANGTIQDIGTLGGRSMGLDVNVHGQVTGISDTVSGQQHAFLYTDGTMRDLGTLGGTYSIGRGINAAGVVVGASTLVSGDSATIHAFRTYDCGLVDLGTLAGGNRSQADAINDAGVIAGVSNGAGFLDSGHAFLYADGVMRDIGSLGGFTLVEDINSLGQVVGSSNGVGFLYTEGRMIDLTTLLDTPGWTVTRAYAINDAQQIAAAVTDGAGGFGTVRLDLVSAVPEPQVYALLLGGLALLGVRSRRRARWSPVAG